MSKVQYIQLNYIVFDISSGQWSPDGSAMDQCYTLNFLFWCDGDSRQRSRYEICSYEYDIM